MEMKRLFKQVVGIGVLAGGAWLCYDSWLRRASDYALVVADVAVLRTPIPGIVDHRLKLGQTLEANAALATVENRWIDDTYLRALEARAAAFDDGDKAFEAHGSNLEQAKSTMDMKSQRRSALQRQQVDALIEESAALQEGAAGARLVAEQRRLRTQSLASMGISSHDALETAQLTELTATSQEEARQHLIESLQVARSAARSGLSVSNSLVGDTNYAEQRKDDITLQLLALRRDKALYRTEQLDTRTRLAAERRRLDRLRQASLVLPSPSRVWRVIATTGEYVTPGQPVAELVRCDTLRVLAQVSERTFTSLRIGTGARVALQDDAGKYEGSVEQLLGPWQAGRDLGGLRLPDAKATSLPERYAVVVRVAGLASSKAGDCTIGRTGRVDFGGSWL